MAPHRGGKQTPGEPPLLTLLVPVNWFGLKRAILAPTRSISQSQVDAGSKPPPQPPPPLPPP